MLSKLGHKVMSLTRIAIGPVSLKGLPAGECRPLTRHEVDLLRKVASGVAVTTPRSDEDEFSRGPRPPHSHGSHRPRPGKADRSPTNTGARGHPPASGRYRDKTAPGGARSNHLQGPRPHGPGSKQAPRLGQSGPHNKRATGSAGGSPAETGGSKHPAIAASPAAQPPRPRRIIGLEPEPSAGSRQGARRRSVAKRPPARKPRLRLRRPEQKPLRVLPNPGDETEGTES